MEGVQKAIAKSGKIDRKLAHSMFVGPTGSGKSSLMDRLLGRQRKKFSASTGVCDSVVIVDITITNPSTFHPVTILDGDTWEAIECDVSYVRQLGQESVNVKNPPENPLPKPTEKRAHTCASARPDPARKVGSVRVAKPHSKRKDAPVPLPRRKLKVSTIISSENINSVIKKYGFRKVKKYLKKTCSLYLRDTGGQVEFQEMLPLLIFGPSIFFFIFRLDLDFKSKLCVQYRMSANKSINCYTSSITTEEALLQCLTSVYAMDTSEEDSVKTHKPMVFIVGTHKDRLGSEAEGIIKINDLNRHLDSIIRRNGFRDLVQYAGDDHVMFAVDNTSDSEEDFQKIRSKVNHLINVRKWFSIEYPMSYLLFCLDLQNMKQSILTLDECKDLAAQHGIEEDQVSHLLRFLHIRIGVIRYFDIEGLKHIVVKEPQVLFDMITDLLVKTFSSESVTTKEAFDFRKGILAASAFEDVASSDYKISPKEFLQLLIHLRIITPFTTSEDQEERYFIPCVLNHVPESPDEDSIPDILPLLFKFKSDHCPKGIFGVLTTHLMTPEKAESEEVGTTFVLIHDKIFKDQVSFEVHSPWDQDEMSLKVYSTHLEVKFFPFSSNDDRGTPLKEVCNNVRQILEKSILRSLKGLHYSEEKLDPMACFKCEHCTQMHPVRAGRTHHRIYCNKARKGSRIPLNGRCWYNEGQSI